MVKFVNQFQSYFDMSELIWSIAKIDVTIEHLNKLVEETAKNETKT